MDWMPLLPVRSLYDSFDAPVTPFDCGALCRVHNPTGKPFCCDICHAVPAVYAQEWAYLAPRTDLWHVWRGDECPTPPEAVDELRAQTPDSMILLACLGPAHCQRPYRSISCREFPFFPYLHSDGRFLGLAVEWEYEPTCWVISHLQSVTPQYRREFVAFYDRLFAVWDDEMEAYAARSEELREHYAALRRRAPLLHRNGADYWLSPTSERLTKLPAGRAFPTHGVYQE